MSEEANVGSGGEGKRKTRSSNRPKKTSSESEEKREDQGRSHNMTSRRIFTPQFKAAVLEAFTSDPDCVGNQRATARKFNIHRRQVQKWLQQSDTPLDNNEDENEIKTGDSMLKSPGKGEEEPSDGCENLISSPSTSPSTMPIAGKSVVHHLPPPQLIGSKRADDSLNDYTRDYSILLALNLHKNPERSSPLHSSPPKASSSLLMSPPGPNVNNTNGYLNGPSLHSQNSSPSPGNGSNHSSNNFTSYSSFPVDIVDELSYIYPNSDFSLLRKAILKNEVTFTKLSPKKVNGRNFSFNTNNSSNSTDTPRHSEIFTAHQTLEMLKKQNETFQQLFQGGLNHSGLNIPTNLSLFAPDLNLENSGGGKFGGNSGWIHPLHHAMAAAGIQTGGGKKKANNNHSGQNSLFVLPPKNGNGKAAKTVAAALAASRLDAIPRTKKGAVRKQRQPKGSNGITHPNNGMNGGNRTATITRPIEDQELDYSNHSNSNHVNSNSSSLHEIPSMHEEMMDSGMDLSKKKNGFIESPPLLVENGHDDWRGSQAGGKISPQEGEKNAVLDAFTYDPEVAGDARGVARKFGLNVRVVMKWLKEGAKPKNGDSLLFNGNGGDLIPKNSTGVNKRKNPNPNQICDYSDFPTGQDEEAIMMANGPLDMVVPIKKRRFSNPSM